MSAFDFSMVEYRDGGLYWIVAPRRGVSIGTRIGTTNSDSGYRKGSFKGTNYAEHRLIWELHNGPIPEGMEVDHVDRVRDNNVISNLRLASRTQNSRNHSIHSNNSTGHKNVGSRTRGNCVEYTCRITADGVTRHKSSVNLATVLAWRDAQLPLLHLDFATDGRKVG